MTQYDDTREIHDRILNFTDKVMKLKVLSMLMIIYLYNYASY